LVVHRDTGLFGALLRKITVHIGGAVPIRVAGFEATVLEPAVELYTMGREGALTAVSTGEEAVALVRPIPEAGDSLAAV
jgi:hypothetical protein